MWKSIAATLLLGLASVGCTPHVTTEHTQPKPAPEFVGLDGWLNSEPLTLGALRGKVVLVEFWTYSCINCMHVVPHLEQWHERYESQGLVVIGVHTPEFDEEHSVAGLRAAIDRFGISYPVAQDNGYHTWNAYANQYWPALYLIDTEGRIVHRHYGEGDYDGTEGRIRRLLSAR